MKHQSHEEYVAERSARDPEFRAAYEQEMDKAAEQAVLEFTVSMDYPGGGISKNRLFRAGNRRRGMTKLAAQWRRDLVESVRNQLLYDRVESVVSVELTVSGTFLGTRYVPDMQNLLEIVSDAVEEATGVNDREFTTRTEPPRYSRDQHPEIVVGLRLEAVRKRM